MELTEHSVGASHRARGEQPKGSWEQIPELLGFSYSFSAEFMLP